MLAYRFLLPIIFDKFSNLSLQPEEISLDCVLDFQMDWLILFFEVFVLIFDSLSLLSLN